MTASEFFRGHNSDRKQWHKKCSIGILLHSGLNSAWQSCCQQDLYTKELDTMQQDAYFYWNEAEIQGNNSSSSCIENTKI